MNEHKFDLEDMRYYADRYRGSYKNSGPYWSTIIRFPVLFDELERQIEENKKLQDRIKELENKNEVTT